MYHIGLKKADIEEAKYAIIPGDPGRAGKIAEYLDKPRHLGQNREYNCYIGYINGESVLVMSTGIGGPSTAIAVEELAKLGVTDFIRVGTCGGMQMEVLPGDVIIANGAIRMEGTSKEYLPVEFPAIADLELTMALKRAAVKQKHPHHVGVVQCKDSFYGQHSPDSMPVGDELKSKWHAWIKGGALASEMESAALYCVCSVRKLRASALFVCVWNQQRRDAGLIDEDIHDTSSAISIAVEAIRLRITEK